MKNLNATPATAGKSTKTNRIILGMAAGMLAVLAVACQKENNAGLRPGNEVAVVISTPGDSAAFTYTNTFGKLFRSSTNEIYTVKNFLQGTVNNTGNPPHIANSKYYYSLRSNDGTDSANADLVFSGTANADVSVYTAYTLSFARTSFDSIATGLVSPTWTSIATKKIGLNSIDTVNYTVVAGWYNYNIVRHEALPVIEHGKFLTVRATTAGGRTFIIELQDLYSNRTPNAYKTPSNYPYLHFRYKEI